MVLSPRISTDIIEDVISRHKRQIIELNAITELAESDPENLFRQLIRLEADLQDIRQGLYAAAYVAISCASGERRSDDLQSSLGDAAVTRRAHRHFRGG